MLYRCFQSILSNNLGLAAGGGRKSGRGVTAEAGAGGGGRFPRPAAAQARHRTSRAAISANRAPHAARTHFHSFKTPSGYCLAGDRTELSLRFGQIFSLGKIRYIEGKIRRKIPVWFATQQVATWLGSTIYSSLFTKQICFWTGQSKCKGVLPFRNLWAGIRILHRRPVYT